MRFWQWSQKHATAERPRSFAGQHPEAFLREAQNLEF